MILVTVLYAITLAFAISIYNVSSFMSSTAQPQVADTTLLTVVTDNPQYILRQNVTIMGNTFIDGAPASNILVSIEVHDSQPQPLQQTLFYRTVPVGEPYEEWCLEITNISIRDQNWNLIDTIKIGNTVYFAVTVYNPRYYKVEPIIITISIFDGNNIPIKAIPMYEGGIESKTSLTAYQLITIPKWAKPGKAYVYCNVYNRIPSQGGIPYVPEKSAEFYLSLTNQGLFGQLPLPMRTHSSSSDNGTYKLTFRLSSAPEPGIYMAYATGRFSPLMKITNNTTFEVLDAVAPPQASFIFTPLEPYPNQTVTFDGSSSTAEGYGDVIIRYEWDFGDGSPRVVKSGNLTHPPDPTVTHRFMSSGQYIVTLNVTDAEGYWSTTQKPIKVKQTNPKAAFIWYPTSPLLNRTVIFNATNSQPGWSIPKGDFAPIVNYVWNFGDGNITTVTTPTITHVYTTHGNFTVSLTVIDSENQQDTISYIVQVQNKTSPPYDINGDGVVNIIDVATVAAAFGSYPGAPNWNPAADITGPAGVPDGKVDIIDVALVAAHFGEYIQ
jgi:PKD repeat protein